MRDDIRASLIVSKESACTARDPGLILGGLILGQGDPLEKETATHFSNSCLENPMDREEQGRLQSMESQELNMTEQLSINA